MSPVSFLSSRTRLAPEGIGKPVLRQEDSRLLTGGGCYSDDVNLPGQAYTCFVRSPHAHARIVRVDTAAALAAPGVIAVLTGRDAAADGVKPITHTPVPANPHEEVIRPRDVPDDGSVESPLEPHFPQLRLVHAERLDEVRHAAMAAPGGHDGAERIAQTEDVRDVGSRLPAEVERQGRRDAHPPEPCRGGEIVHRRAVQRDRA